MDAKQDDEHRKPPPPYEEVERQSSNIQSPTEKQSEPKISTYHLSIENPMAEVFSNPEFDHVEMKIKGHINPVEQSSSLDSSKKTVKDFVPLSPLAKLFQDKSRQVFIQWKDWHRPEVIAIRLALLMIALLLMLQLVRLVIPDTPTEAKNTNININKNESSASSLKQELKVHSARTGKALTQLLDSDLDHPEQQQSSVRTAIKVDRTKLEQPDQDLIELTNANSNHQSSSESNRHTIENHRSMENETPLMEQDLDDHHHNEISSTRPQQNWTIKIDTTPKIAPSSTTPTPTTTLSTTNVATSTMTPSRTTSRLSLVASTNSPKTQTKTQADASNLANNNKTYNISIIIHSANVPDMDSGYLMGRASDTYCNVFIDDVLVGKTPIIDNSNNPSWHYLLPRQFSVKRDTWIKIELMDSDHVRNDHIGGILLNFGDLLKNDSLNKPINMFHGRGYIWVTISSANS